MNSKLEPLLRTIDLRMHFPIARGLFAKPGLLKAVDGVSLEVYPGECLGLVGESGCGKSTLGRCLIRLYNPTSGSIAINGMNITQIKGEALRKARTDFQMIFQDPFASLNPRLSVFEIIAEPLKTFKRAANRADLDTQVQNLMTRVGLSPRFLRKYPHEFSGGQRQRIAVARALALRPKLVVCDEPVSALDVSIQAQVLNLLQDLQKEFGISYVFIAHDLSAVRHISDRIAVMYLGRIVEVASRTQLFKDPKHPYTRALLSAVPVPDPDKERHRQRVVLKGELPSPMNPPPGCTFHTRCPLAEERCRKESPALRQLNAEQQVACHLAN